MSTQHVYHDQPFHFANGDPPPSHPDGRSRVLSDAPSQNPSLTPRSTERYGDWQPYAEGSDDCDFSRGDVNPEQALVDWQVREAFSLSDTAPIFDERSGWQRAFDCTNVKPDQLRAKHNQTAVAQTSQRRSRSHYDAPAMFYTSVSPAKAFNNPWYTLPTPNWSLADDSDPTFPTPFSGRLLTSNNQTHTGTHAPVQSPAWSPTQPQSLWLEDDNGIRVQRQTRALPERLLAYIPREDPNDAWVELSDLTRNEDLYQRVRRRLDHLSALCNDDWYVDDGFSNTGTETTWRNRSHTLNKLEQSNLWGEHMTSRFPNDLVGYKIVGGMFVSVTLGKETLAQVMRENSADTAMCRLARDIEECLSSRILTHRIQITKHFAVELTGGTERSDSQVSISILRAALQAKGKVRHELKERIQWGAYQEVLEKLEAQALADTV